MKKAPILAIAIAALLIAVVPASADYYATKQDFKNGKLTPGRPPAKAGGDTCGATATITAIPMSGGMVNFVDTGDTSTGATSTVGAVPNSCTGTSFDGNAGGPDHIWEFTVGTGNNLRFELTTSSSTYDPMMYTLANCGDAGSCQVGADACLNADMELPADPCLGNSMETIQSSFTAPGTYYLYVDSWYSVAGSPTQAQGPYELTVTGTIPVELLRFSVD